MGPRVRSSDRVTCFASLILLSHQFLDVQSTTGPGSIIHAPDHRTFLGGRVEDPRSRPDRGAGSGVCLG